jgi:hypothetical protein
LSEIDIWRVCQQKLVLILRFNAGNNNGRKK